MPLNLKNRKREEDFELTLKEKWEVQNSIIAERTKWITMGHSLEKLRCKLILIFEVKSGKKQAGELETLLKRSRVTFLLYPISLLTHKRYNILGY